MRACLLDRSNDFARAVGHAVCGNDVEAALGEDLLPEIDVRTFKANDERYFEADLLHSFDDPFCDDITLHDAAEDVDEDALHVRVARDDAERCGDLFGRRTATYVEEVCRGRTEVLDDVHRRHREARTVHHAADGTI